MYKASFVANNTSFSIFTATNSVSNASACVMQATDDYWPCLRLYQEYEAWRRKLEANRSSNAVHCRLSE